MPSKSRATRLPLQPGGLLGSFMTAPTFLTIAAPGAGTTYWSMRWTSATALCVVTRLELQLQQLTTSTAGNPHFGIFFATGFTVSDSTGTPIVSTGRALKKRTSYATSLLAAGDLRYGNAAAVTAGTRTLDAEPLHAATVSPGASINTGAPLYGRDLNDDPIVLAVNEGLVLNNIVGQTAGVTRGTLHIEWSEVPLGSY